MANLIDGISKNPGGITQAFTLVPKQIPSIGLKYSILVNLFNPSEQKITVPFSGQLTNQAGKAGFVVYSLFQIRSETIIEESRGETKYLVELFEASDLGPEGEEDEILPEEELDLSEVEEFVTEDEDAEEAESLDMEQGPSDEREGSSFSEEEEEVCSRKSLVLKEMWENTKKTMLMAENRNSMIYASIFEGLRSFKEFNVPSLKNTTIELQCKILYNAGFQHVIKESCFFQETEEGFFLGVFAGSRYAPSFTKKVSEECAGVQWKGVEAFYLFVDRIKEEIRQNQLWHIQGSSGILSFIEKKTGLIYTSGWGNHQLYISRRIGASCKFIPLFAEECRLGTVQILDSKDTIYMISEGCNRCFSKEELWRKAEQGGKAGDLALSLLNDALYLKRARENISILVATVL